METETGTQESAESTTTEDQTSSVETDTDVGITGVDTQTSEEESTEQTIDEEPEQDGEQGDGEDTSETSQGAVSDPDIDPARVDMVHRLVEEKMTRSRKLLEKTSRISDSELHGVLEQELDHIRSLVTEGENARGEGDLKEAGETLKHGLARVQDVITVLEIAKTANHPSALTALFEYDANTGGSSDEVPEDGDAREAEGGMDDEAERKGTPESDSTEDLEGSGETEEGESSKPTEEEAVSGDEEETDEEQELIEATAEASNE